MQCLASAETLGDKFTFKALASQEHGDEFAPFVTTHVSDSMIEAEVCRRKVSSQNGYTVCRRIL